MNLKFVLKVIISLALVALVLKSTDFEQLKITLLSLPLSTVVMVVSGYTLGQLLSSCKWWIIASSGGIKASYPKALKSYFIGMFVNCFGLGTVGGDLTRGLLIAGGKRHSVPALASVVADRAHGLAVLSIIGSMSAFFFGAHVVEPWLNWGLILLPLIIMSCWILGPNLLKCIAKSRSLKSVSESALALEEKAHQIAMVFPKKPQTILLITLISICFHLLQIYLHRVMGLGLGVDIPFTRLLIVIPFVSIVTTLPISWNGLGIRENAYVYFLSPLILSFEQSVAFGAIWLLAVTLASAVGGIVAFLTQELKLNKPVQGKYAA